MAGKLAVFKVKVNKVAEPKLPAINEELMEKSGLKARTEEEMRKEVVAPLEVEMGFQIRRVLRDRAIELLSKNSKNVKLPPVLINKSLVYLLNSKPELAGLTAESNPDHELVKEATKQAYLSVILDQIVREYKISLSQKKIDERLKEMAMTYMDAAEFKKWYYEDKARVDRLHNDVMEEQVIEACVEKMKKKDDVISYGKLKDL